MAGKHGFCHSGQALAGQQPAVLMDLTGSLCDVALDPGATCCNSTTLDEVEQELRTLVSTSAACFHLRQRHMCASACELERTRWWDAAAGVAHLCDAFCEDLYRLCYEPVGVPEFRRSYPYRNVAEFCATQTGMNRSDASACCILPVEPACLQRL